ncbi:hypothetical protein [Flavobacterium sp. 83]|uniref:hypothetical protein n=1 Tax=Flavobacterium sp. 83 TaxID=1131812 RepID=UPI000554CB96|nr:hypothetical protein [Flavobacterium sp. 83]
MMDRDSIAKKLGVERLEDYIIDEFLIGKSEVDVVLEVVFKESKEDLDQIRTDEIKIVRILSELIKIKNEFSDTNNNYFSHIIKDAKDFASDTLLDVINEKDELNNLAKYILDFWDFKKTRNFVVKGQLLKIRENSRKYHLILNYISKSKIYFDFLNDNCKIDRYTWNWLNFEQGLIRVLGNHAVEKISLDSDYKLKKETFELHTNREVEDLKSELKDLKREIGQLNKEIEIRTNVHNKYYYDTQVMISDTYIGDNLPFLFNLYNFLKSNNLFSYGWSYFYSCMIIGNNEMIPLKSSKKQNFIGRIFFHFKDYLILHYKDESFKFLQSKFLINESPITENFRTNHMKTKFDFNDEPELVVIDEFFAKQKKIYIKM